MSTSDFTTTLLVDQSPIQVFEAILNVRAWWSEEIEGPTDELDAVFKYRYEDVHLCNIRLIEVVPERKIVWLVLENYFKFTKDKSEWIGTQISFEIAPKGAQTQLMFTHWGLVPEYECFEICRDAWTNYIQNSLCGLITTGKGQPNGKDKPQTADEARLTSSHQ